MRRLPASISACSCWAWSSFICLARDARPRAIEFISSRSEMACSDCAVWRLSACCNLDLRCCSLPTIGARSGRFDDCDILCGSRERAVDASERSSADACSGESWSSGRTLGAVGLQSSADSGEPGRSRLVHRLGLLIGELLAEPLSEPEKSSSTPWYRAALEVILTTRKISLCMRNVEFRQFRQIILPPLMSRPESIRSPPTRRRNGVQTQIAWIEGENTRGRDHGAALFSQLGRCSHGTRSTFTRAGLRPWRNSKLIKSAVLLTYCLVW